MARTSIVTDSTSGLDPEEAKTLGIAIIPIHMEIGEQSYREGVDISSSEAYQFFSSSSDLPLTSPPTVQEFHALFRELARDSEEILAVHLSSRLGATVNVARQAAQSFLGRTRVTVVDSRLVAAPLAWLAQAASEAAKSGVDTREIVRLLRAMTPRMYLAFFTETMEYLRDGGLVRRAPVISVGTPAATKPLLMVEEGEIVPLERSRSRGRAVDRLYEFVTEFSRLERISILQGKPLPEALELATLLNEKMPEEHIETRGFPPSVAAHVGVDALGVAVYEGLA